MKRIKTISAIFLLFMLVGSQSAKSQEAEIDLVIPSADKAILHTAIFSFYYTMLADDSPFNSVTGEPIQRKKFLTLTLDDMKNISDNYLSQECKKKYIELSALATAILEAGQLEPEEAKKIYKEIGFSSDQLNPMELSERLTEGLRELAEKTNAPNWLRKQISDK